MVPLRRAGRSADFPPPSRCRAAPPNTGPVHRRARPRPSVLHPRRRSRCATAHRARPRGWSRQIRPRSDVPAPLPKGDARSPGPQTTPSSCSRRLDEAVQDFLRAGFLELDVELVAVDRQDAAVTELLVEDPLANAEIDLVAFDGAAVVERLVAPARAPAGRDAQALIVEAAGLLAQPAVMAGRIGCVEAGVAALGQLLGRQLAPGARRGGRLPLVEHAPVGGEGDVSPLARPRQTDIGQPPLPLAPGHAL